MVIYGLYMTTKRWFYEGGSDESTWLIGTDVDKDKLRDRWNLHQKSQCLETCHLHPDYHMKIDAPLNGCDTVTWAGSTGGGCSRVDHTLEIKRVPQMDDEK